MTSEERKSYMRAYRTKRKAEGICVRCGKPVNGKYASCPECLESERKRQRLHYRQKTNQKIQEELKQ